MLWSTIYERYLCWREQQAVKRQYRNLKDLTRGLKVGTISLYVTGVRFLFSGYHVTSFRFERHLRTIQIFLQTGASRPAFIRRFDALMGNYSLLLIGQYMDLNVVFPAIFF